MDDLFSLLIAFVLLTLAITPWLINAKLKRSAIAAERSATALEVSNEIRGTIADASEDIANALLRIAGLGERKEREYLRLKRELEDEKENRFDPLVEDVYQALSKEPDRVGPDLIHVERVGEGMIYLTGCVNSQVDQQLALEITRAVPGVVKVYEDIQIFPDDLRRRAVDSEETEDDSVDSQEQAASLLGTESLDLSSHSFSVHDLVERDQPSVTHARDTGK